MEAKKKDITSKLINSVFWNNLDQVLDCLSLGADPNAAISKTGSRLVHVAAARSNGIEVLDALVANGASVNSQTSKENWTPIGVAVESTRLEHIEYLIEKGVDVNKTAGYFDWKPLHIAVSIDSIAICKFLLENGASANVNTDTLDTPLHVLAESLRFGIRSDEAPRILTRLLFEVSEQILLLRHQLGETPLYTAVRSENVPVTEELLKGELDLDAKAGPEGGLLNLACVLSREEDESHQPTEERLKIVQLLCQAYRDRKLNIEVKTPRQVSVLLERVFTFPLHHDLEIIRILLEHGADPNLVCHWDGDDKTKLTPLTMALRRCWHEGVKKSGELVQLLLDHGGSPNVKIANGTMIQFFMRTTQVKGQFLDIIKFIIEEFGADPNTMGCPKFMNKSKTESYLDKEMTPMHLAIVLRDNSTFDYFCSLQQVDLNAQDEDGRTLCDLALEDGNSRAFKKIKEEMRRRKKSKAKCPPQNSYPFLFQAPLKRTN